MTFEQRLAARTAPIEQRLSDLFSTQRMTGVPARLLAAMRHAVLGQGKRFRPFLVLESAALFGLAADAAIDAACALECLHCYSLVHDDLPAMDNDKLRRGAPTVWAAFDEWTAVLAGDALLTAAFEIMANATTHPDPTLRLNLISGLARASGAIGMVGGQALDMEAEKLEPSAHPTLAHIRRLQAMKTGALITFAVEAGAILGRAETVQHQAVARYGAALGLAFQIGDDLLDVEGDTATVGKAVAKDASLGKATLVSLMGIEMARSQLAEAEADAIAALNTFGAAAEPLREAARFLARRKR